MSQIETIELVIEILSTTNNPQEVIPDVIVILQKFCAIEQSRKELKEEFLRELAFENEQDEQREYLAENTN